MDWNIIATFIKENAILSITIPLLIWLYKEFKVMIIKEEADTIALIQSKLIMFAKLKSKIAYITHYSDAQSKKELFEQLAEASLYMNENSLQIINEYYKSNDFTILYKLN